MKLTSILTTCCILLGLSSVGRAETSSPAFSGDPPDAHHPWGVHDRNRPQPKVVIPGSFSSETQPGTPPSDAIVLFNGTNLINWQTGKDGHPAKWLVTNGVMQAVPKAGTIRTIEQFGDCQLHIEWSAPREINGTGQGRGNSGIFLMGLCEIQVLDSYDNVTYADGHAAAVYGVNPPLVNAVRPPGEFQVYDIVFRRPIFKDGQLVDPGFVTVFVNGVLVQDHTPLEGPSTHLKRTRPAPYPEKGPLALQDHGNPIRFRNIWYRPLPPRAAEGGTDGYLSSEAIIAIRKQTAARIRRDAGQLGNPTDPVPQLLRLMESLVYEKDETTMRQVEQMAIAYVQTAKQLTAEKLEAKKDEALRLSKAFHYLSRANMLAADFGPKRELETFIKEQQWNKK